ncbi:MAG: NAD(P)-dependent glycerol-3-phosphate dehydrogenase [Candidatus Magnetoovum sp. WYHC-5]|nr:NAD(P)-dependent glycerol-3-phosphate dehydrogenase [Candidatus Magnetoovum sp. WYHC-5]
MNLINVIGAGAWGSALANLLASKGYNVTLWVYEQQVIQEIETTGMNSVYLPGISLSKGIAVTNDLALAVKDTRYILLVVPTQYVRTILKQISKYINSETVIITAIKGIEQATLKTASAIIEEFLPNKIAVLSGPSFAKEVAFKKPTAITLAIKDLAEGAYLQDIFNTDYFRVYTHTDTIGTELGGALKNVIAIAAGIADGLQLGLNARAALITRGLSEIVRLGVKLGADFRTFSGLSGLGDLVLTCTGELSRNYTVGVKLGQGFDLQTILAHMNAVCEGIKTSASAYELSKKHGVEMPIVEQVYKVIHENTSPALAVQTLMARQLKTEFWI